MIHPLTRTACSAAALCLAAAEPGTAETLEFSVPQGVATSALGQAVIPASAVPDLPDDASLASVTFFAGGPGGAAGSDRTRLAILPTAYPDFSGHLKRTAAAGVSTNFVDTANAAAGAPLRFNFKRLRLPPGNAAAAVLVTIDEFGNLQPAPASVRFVHFEGSGDAAAPAANPGGAGNYDFAALFPDDNGDGYPQGAADGQDLAFTLTFETPDPAAPAEAE